MPFHVVLHEPEIPNNTGNIGRTCVALGSTLHLIDPLGFEVSEKACRRAGLDYWPRLDHARHASWDSYLADARPAPERLWLTSGLAGRPVWEAPLRPGDHFVFGKETAGLPNELLDAHPERVLTLPLLPAERGLNVATAVCAVLYEALRQSVTRGDLALDPNTHRLKLPAQRRT